MLFSDDVSYEALVKNVFTEELRYLKDLQLIIKVFKKEFLARPSLFTEAVCLFVYGTTY